ncbi:MAG: preprotein translocase subunit SecG [Bacteroidota bacterium]
MNFLLILSTTFLVIVSILLTALIMLQGPQDDEGGAMGSTRMNASFKMLGAAQASNLIEKITGILGALFMVLVLTTTYFMKQNKEIKETVTQTEKALENVDASITTEMPAKKDVPKKAVPKKAAPKKAAPKKAAPKKAVPKKAAPAIKKRKKARRKRR